MRRALLLACVVALAGCGGSDEATQGPAQSSPPTLPAEHAVNYLPHVAPNALFLQFGNEGTRPSPEEADEVEAAASAPKRAKSYDGGHELNDRARIERED